MKFCVHISLHRLHVENPLKLHSLFDNNVHHQRPRLQRSSTRLDLSSMPETEVLLSLVSKALHPRSALKLQLCNFVQHSVFKLQLCASVHLCDCVQLCKRVQMTHLHQATALLCSSQLNKSNMHLSKFQPIQRSCIAHNPVCWKSVKCSCPAKRRYLIQEQVPYMDTNEVGSTGVEVGQMFQVDVKLVSGRQLPVS